jgi:peptide chain release factor 2
MNELRDRIKKLAERLEKALSILNTEEDRNRMTELENKTSEPDFWQDQQTAQATMQEIANIRKHLEAWDGITAEINNIAGIAEITAENDNAMIKDLENDLNETEDKFEKLEFELFFSEKYDKNNALVTVSAGSGGTEAQDWAEMLLRMYLRFCEKEGFETNIIQESVGEEAGIKSVTVEIKGYYAFGYLKSEKGVHRLVRLSPFDADHARHTSFALVEVFPEIEETEYKLDEKELKIETFRSSGHGGQSVNTTDSAVRITHLPTGIQATSQNERSQLQNKQTALKVLKSRLITEDEKKKEEEMAKLRGESVSAEWGNQIRSYVLHPYNLVKDHRTGFETSDTEAVLNGKIDEFIEAYLRKNAKNQ